MTATSLPPAAEPAPPAAGEHPNTLAAVIAAAGGIDTARARARRYQITPRWRDRLTREAVALVDAVLEHDRTEPAG